MNAEGRKGQIFTQTARRAFATYRDLITEELGISPSCELAIYFESKPRISEVFSEAPLPANAKRSVEARRRWPERTMPAKVRHAINLELWYKIREGTAAKPSARMACQSPVTLVDE